MDLSRPVERLAVLVSGSGSNLQALLDTGRDDLGADIVVVGSDRREAFGLERAARHGVPTVATEVAEHPDRAAWEEHLATLLAEHRPEAVVLAGFMRVVSPRFLARWPGRVVNTHPSLLPAFPGAHAVRDALAHGVKVTGATVHLVDEQVDHGPIIAQRALDIADADTEASLHERIKAIEHDLLPRCVTLLCRGQLSVDGRHVRVGVRQ